MVRHRQRDEEAGGDGLGVIESRKKLWRDADGNIVNKRPAGGDDHGPTMKRKAFDQSSQPQRDGLLNSYDFEVPQTEPLSPPKSMLSAESVDAPLPMPEFYNDNAFVESVNGPDASMFDFLANSSWGSNTTSSSMCIGGGMPSEDMFNPDTGEFQKQIYADLGH
jgi:hypothetical protein